MSSICRLQAILSEPMLKTASYRTLGFREYGMVNASNIIVSVPLLLASTPKSV